MAASVREPMVWQTAMALVKPTYALAAPLPQIERFGLASQVRRAGNPIPSNIAEGLELRSRADYRRFLTIACGSLAELEAPLELARRLHDADPDTIRNVARLADETGRLVRPVERALRVPRIADASAGYDVTLPSAFSPQP
jgi:four helix bundle protein